MTKEEELKKDEEQRKVQISRLRNLKISLSNESYPCETRKNISFFEEMLISGRILKTLNANFPITEKEFMAKVILTDHPLQVVRFQASNTKLHSEFSIPWMGSLKLDSIKNNELAACSLTCVVGHEGIGFKTFFISFNHLPLPPFDRISNVMIVRQRHVVRGHLVHAIQVMITISKESIRVHPRIRVLFSPLNASAVILDPQDSCTETLLIPLTVSPADDNKSSVVRMDDFR